MGRRLFSPDPKAAWKWLNRSRFPIGRADIFPSSQLEHPFRIVEYASTNGVTREEPTVDQTRQSLVRLGS